MLASRPPFVCTMHSPDTSRLLLCMRFLLFSSLLFSSLLFSSLLFSSPLFSSPLFSFFPIGCRALVAHGVLSHVTQEHHFHNRVYFYRCPNTPMHTRAHSPTHTHTHPHTHALSSCMTLRHAIAGGTRMRLTGCLTPSPTMVWERQRWRWSSPLSPHPLTARSAYHRRIHSGNRQSAVRPRPTRRRHHHHHRRHHLRRHCHSL